MSTFGDFMISNAVASDKAISDLRSELKREQQSHDSEILRIAEACSLSPEDGQVTVEAIVKQIKLYRSTGQQ